MESTSSMKIIEGFLSLAILNKALINFSDSPTYLEIKSAEEILKNVASHSVAQALAKKVFPVPGGPYSKIPFQGYLTLSKSYGNLIGIITASFNLALAASKPATSSHFTLGFSVTIACDKASEYFLSSSFSPSPSLIPDYSFLF